MGKARRRARSAGRRPRERSPRGPVTVREGGPEDRPEVQAIHARGVFEVGRRESIERPRGGFYEESAATFLAEGDGVPLAYATFSVWASDGVERWCVVQELVRAPGADPASARALLDRAIAFAREQRCARLELSSPAGASRSFKGHLRRRLGTTHKGERQGPDVEPVWRYLGFPWPDRRARREACALHLEGRYESSDLRDARRLIERSLELDPEQIDARLDYALVLEGLCEGNEALRQLALLERGGADLEHAAEVCEVRAQILASRGDRAGARKELDRGIALDPSAFPLRLARGKLHLAAGEIEAAIEAYEDLERHSPIPEAREELCDLYLRIGDRERALALARRLDRANRDLVAGPLALARVADAAGDGSEALRQLRRALDRSPDACEVHAAFALLWQTAQPPDHRRARAAFRRALSLPRRKGRRYLALGAQARARALEGLAESLRALGDEAGAEGCLAQARDLRTAPPGLRRGFWGPADPG